MQTKFYHNQPIKLKKIVKYLIYPIIHEKVLLIINFFTQYLQIFLQNSHYPYLKH